MHLFAYQHNGVVGAVSIDGEQQIALFRLPTRNIVPEDGPINGEQIHDVLRLARPLLGHVNDDLRIALGKALTEMLKEMR